MLIRRLKKVMASIALVVLILSSGLMSSSTVLANSPSRAIAVGQGRGWHWGRDRRRGRGVRFSITVGNRGYGPRYGYYNRARPVGYYDRWGYFHQTGYYDRWGYFHRY
jgi:hypothetical protein